MTKGRSLKQSLGMLCGVIAAACAVLYSITLVYVLETAESKLMASVMDDMLQTVVTADILQGKPPRLDQVSRLYIEGDPSREIPDLFRHNPQGYTEFTDGEDLHTYTKIINGKRYVLTRHQGNFEIWERHLFRIGVVGFLLLIAICSFVGWYLGRKLLSPLGQLTKEAVRAEGLIQNGKIYTEEIFKGHWPENEIGELERSFKVLVSKLKVLAMKERAFSTEVSHEVRTPLTVIDTSLELLNEQVQGNDRQKTLIRQCTECLFSNQRDGGSFLKYRTRSNRSEQRALLNARTHCRLERVLETKSRKQRVEAFYRNEEHAQADI